jgi:hypothetical protein
MLEEAAFANSLTGDFDAVLQVSESTINRLMATLHQNAGTQKDEKGKLLPGHPHAISVRIRPVRPSAAAPSTSTTRTVVVVVETPSTRSIVSLQF